MTTDPQRVLEAAFPGENARYFASMSIGHTPETADEGAALILDGIKTTTSSAHWEYPDGRIPFGGALSVLLDGKGHPRAIVETERVEIKPFRTVDEGSNGFGPRWELGTGTRPLGTASTSPMTPRSSASGLPWCGRL